MALFKRIWGIFSGSTSTNATQETQVNVGTSPFGRGRPFVYDPFSGNGTEPPEEAGLYWFIGENNERVYEGETKDLSRRIKEHKQTGKILPGERFVYKVAKEGSSYETRRDVERKKIQRHNPKRNLRGGGGGRKPK